MQFTVVQKTAREPRKIAVLAYPGANLIDISAPLEVFANCSRSLQRDWVD